MSVPNYTSMNRTKYIIFCLLTTIVGSRLSAQTHPFAHYDVSAKVQPAEFLMSGTVAIHFHNPTKVPMHSIPLQLMYNAFASDTSLYDRQLLKDKNVDFYFNAEKYYGATKLRSITADQDSLQWHYDAHSSEIVWVDLGRDLMPADTMTLHIDFQSQIPIHLGATDNGLFISQAFPQLFLFADQKWQTHAHSSRKIESHNFSDFDIDLQYPTSYHLIADGLATSNRLNVRDIQMPTLYLTRKDYSIQYLASPTKDSLLLWQSSKVDFALDEKISNAFNAAKEELQITSPQKMTIFIGEDVPPLAKNNVTSFVLLSREISSVAMKNAFVKAFWEKKIVWNEQNSKWLLDGLLQQSDENSKSSTSKWLDVLGSQLHFLEYINPELSWRQQYKTNKNQALATDLDSLSTINLVSNKGFATQKWLSQNGYNQSQIFHQFDGDVVSLSQLKQDASVQALNPKSNYSDAVSSHLVPSFLLGVSDSTHSIPISFAPAVGYNFYDKVSVGLLIHNYSIPNNKFNFLVAPMYSFSAKAMTGAGRLEYNIFHQRDDWKLSASGFTYHMNYLEDDFGKQVRTRMYRLTPSVEWKHQLDDWQSTKFWDLRLRYMRIGEQAFTYQQADSNLYHIGTANTTTNLLQFTAKFQDDRVLYPYQWTFDVQQAHKWMRLGVTGKFLFNYSQHKNEGIRVRFFAGKFLYLTDKSNVNTLAYSRYNLTMNAPTGAYDYMYSGYYVGRNQYNGWMSQQMIERDGFLKVSTPNLSTPIGLTDNWLTSLNTTFDIPHLPLRIFADLGTYDALWKDDAPAGKFLYDVGLQAHFLHDRIQVFIPFVYNSVYRDAYKSGGKGWFWRTITFNINLQN